MNLSFLSVFILFASAVAYSCDIQLQSKINNWRFADKECEIQDRFAKVKAFYLSIDRDISDVVEYRTLRFIERRVWEDEISQGLNNPVSIYKPAPTTWNIWNTAIKEIFNDNIYKSTELLADTSKLIDVNKILLSRGLIDISYSESSLSGKMRSSRFEEPVGFCTLASFENMRNKLIEIKSSSKNFLTSWERRAGLTFKELIRLSGGLDYRRANLTVDLTIKRGNCASGRGNFIYYAKSRLIKKYLSWLSIFVDYNIQEYRQNRALVAPIELAAFVQKTLVSLHPFHDGNGRTSRVVQNLIMEEFNMPFVPGGDLQNDVMSKLSIYIPITYYRVEKMLSFLEQCAQDISSNKSKNLRCSFYNEL